MDGFDGVIGDEEGRRKEIFHIHLWTSTNNMVEIMALEQCLEIVMESNLHNAIIEADSKLAINLAKKMCNGTTPGKVSKHWRLLQIFRCIHSHLLHGADKDYKPLVYKTSCPLLDLTPDHFKTRYPFDQNPFDSMVLNDIATETCVTLTHFTKSILIINHWSIKLRM